MNESVQHNHKIFFSVSHIAKHISSLIILSFKHQNPLGGLDVLSGLGWLAGPTHEGKKDLIFPKMISIQHRNR
jgi:hypothetical protein